PAMTMLAATGLSALVLWARIGSSLLANPTVPEPGVVMLSLIVPMFSCLALALAFPIAEFRRDERKLRRAIERDSLTGLPNRVLALKYLDRALERGRPLS